MTLARAAGLPAHAGDGRRCGPADAGKPDATVAVGPGASADARAPLDASQAVDGRARDPRESGDARTADASEAVDAAMTDGRCGTDGCGRRGRGCGDGAVEDAACPPTTNNSGVTRKRSELEPLEETRASRR
jgi:hypothetical protein